MTIDALVRGGALATLPAVAIAAWLLKSEPPQVGADTAASATTGSSSAVAGADTDVVEPGRGSRRGEEQLAAASRHRKTHPALARDLPLAVAPTTLVARPGAHRRHRSASSAGTLDVGFVEAPDAALVLAPSDDEAPSWQVPELIARAIDKRSETEFALGRHAVAPIFERGRSLLAGVAVEPVERAGVTVLSLDGVHDDSLLGRLGVADHDLLLALDGGACDSVAAARDALERWRSAQRARLVARLERDGESFEIEVWIR